MALALAVVLTLLLGACSDSPGLNPPGPSRVDVDTPELRELKSDAGIDECAPGDGEGALPAVTLACLGGGPSVDLSTLTGPLVINFWASNCGPCREEMPALEEFHQKYGDRVAVLGIDSQDTLPGAALQLAGETGATYPQLADPGGELQETELFIQGYPHFAFVDAEGEIVGRAAGGVESLEEVVDLVEANLEVDLDARAGRS